MALFTDGPPATIEDLTAQDSQLLSVASGEGIDVTQKLRLAHEEVGLELCTLMTRMGIADPVFGFDMNPKLENVAVTPPLKLWHTFRTLAMVYADAYNSQLNDRYAGKRTHFEDRARWAHEKLVQSGLGIVAIPLSKAATPSVAAVPGGLQDGTYYVTASWVNQSGEEGAAGPPTASTTLSSTLAVQPTGPVPRNANGWNVYMGAAPDCMVRQNQAPIATGGRWIQPTQVETVGRNPGPGQKPNYLQPVPRVLRRG